MGHSLEWQNAYLTAAPEDQAQRDLMAQLTLPIRTDQTREQAQRVEALRKLIAGLDTKTTYRLYARLTGPADSLGNLFHLTLHHTTRKALLDQLNAKQHDNNRGTDNRNVPPPPPNKQDISPPPPPNKQDIPPPPPPYFYPSIHIPPGWKPIPYGDDDSSGGGSTSRDWLWKLLKSVGTGMGMTVSVLLPALGASSLEAAVAAAWVVFQTSAGLSLTMLVGEAGEAAAVVLLVEELGGAASRAVNLNTIESNFPVVDVLAQTGMSSVKTYGVLSKLSPAQQWDSLRSRYNGDLMDMIRGNKVDRAADLLYKNRRRLARAWPSDLNDKTVEGIKKYIREKADLRILDDHMKQLVQTLPDDLSRLLKKEPRLLSEIGLKTDKQIEDFARRQVLRIKSLGITSNDLGVMLETAYKHLPKDVTERWRKEYKDLLKNRPA